MVQGAGCVLCENYNYSWSVEIHIYTVEYIIINIILYEIVILIMACNVLVYRQVQFVSYTLQVKLTI